MNSSFIPRASIERQTFLEFGVARLWRLCEAVGMGREQASPIIETFRSLSRSWGHWTIGQQPRWNPSILSDDHAPFEFSTASSKGGPEVQIYIEALGDPPSLASNLASGLSILREIARDHGLPLDRWRAMSDLFLPDAPQGLFTLLFGVTWRPGSPLRFKLYLNPQVRGPDAVASLMQEAMARLGLADAWAAASAPCAGRGTGLDELMYLCLDLTAEQHGRAKVYRRHYQATVEELDALASVAADYEEGEAVRFYGAVADHVGPFLAKPVITSLTFREGDTAIPGSVTLEFPLSSYVKNDAEANQRVLQAFRSYDLDPARYEAAIRAVAVRPLDRGNGIHAHITHRRVDDAPRLTVYYATEAYPVDVGIAWPTAPPRSSSDTVDSRTAP
jgi:hypothetical protein